VVYYNSALNNPNYSASTLNFCCATPIPAGSGNFTNEPLLSDAIHININSPCRGSGDPKYSLGVDIDGEAWLVPPSIGSDESYVSGIAGPLSVAIQAVSTNVPKQFSTG